MYFALLSLLSHRFLLTFSNILSAIAKGARALAARHTSNAQRAARLAAYVRRDQEWTFLANQAGLELKQIAKQFTVAKIRKKIAGYVI